MIMASDEQEYIALLLKRMKDPDTPPYIVERLSRRYEAAQARQAGAPTLSRSRGAPVADDEKPTRPVRRSRTPVADDIPEEPTRPVRRQRPGRSPVRGVSDEEYNAAKERGEPF